MCLGALSRVWARARGGAVSVARLEIGLIWALKLALAGVFLAAAWPKLQDPAAFSQEVANYQLLPELAPGIATALPGVELVLALALILLMPASPWLLAAAAVSAVLMAGFTVAVTQVLVRGIDIECGCFGTGSGPITGATVVRDLLYVAGCAALFSLAWRRIGSGDGNRALPTHG